MKGLVTLLSIGFIGSTCLAQPTNLEQARALWLDQTKGLATNYTFQYVETRGAIDPIKNPVVVDVRDDSVTGVSSKFLLLGAPPLVAADYPTIPELFDIIDDAENIAISTDIEYNSKYGYPTAISVVYNVSDTLEIEIPSLTPYTLLEDELKMMQELWDVSFGEDEESYSFTIEVLCFCTQDYISPKRIEVDNSTVVSVTEIQTGLVSGYSYPSITEIFGEIKQSLDNFNVEIFVSFDPQLGYPLSFSTNPNFALADAGVLYELSDVVRTDSSPSGIDNNFGEGIMDGANIEGGIASDMDGGDIQGSDSTTDENIGDASVVPDKPNLGATDDVEVTDDRDKINTAESGDADSSADGASHLYLTMGLLTLSTLSTLQFWH